MSKEKSDSVGVPQSSGLGRNFVPVAGLPYADDRFVGDRESPTPIGLVPP
jgi:hypothetical protein